MLTMDEEAKLAKDINTSPEVLEKLSKSPSTYIRAIVANNKSTPPNILLNLAKDTERTVKWMVANNPSSPLEAFEILLSDFTPEIRSAAQKNIERLKNV